MYSIDCVCFFCIFSAHLFNLHPGPFSPPFLSLLLQFLGLLPGANPARPFLPHPAGFSGGGGERLVQFWAQIQPAVRARDHYEDPGAEPDFLAISRRAPPGHSSLSNSFFLLLRNTVEVAEGCLFLRSILHAHTAPMCFMTVSLFSIVVLQIMRQYPDAFQYNDRLLVFLADHLYSGLFGTFLGDCERDRVRDLQCPTKTTSVWTYVLGTADQFLNRQYVVNPQPLWPSTSMKKLVLWSRYYSRWDPDVCPRYDKVRRRSRKEIERNSVDLKGTEKKAWSLSSCVRVSTTP